MRLVSLNAKPRKPLRNRSNSFRLRCVPNSLMRAHRRNLGVLASSAPGRPSSVQQDGTAACVHFNASSVSASSSKRRKDCFGGGLTPPRPLACPTPSLPHSCGGKGWDINNPCKSCIDAAWCEQVGTGAQSQPESSGEGPFMSRSASANVSMLCQDLGDSSPPPPPLVALGPRGPSSLSSPVGCSTHRGERLELESPESLQCLLAVGA